MQYAQQRNAPEWYKNDEGKLYYSCQMGSSTFNEWYEFDDRKDAIETIKDFHHQSFLDRFTYFEWDFFEWDFFDMDDLIFDDCLSEFVGVKDGCEPADIQSMLDAESPF